MKIKALHTVSGNIVHVIVVDDKVQSVQENLVNGAMIRSERYDDGYWTVQLLREGYDTISFRSLYFMQAQDFLWDVMLDSGLLLIYPWKPIEDIQSDLKIISKL